VSVRRPLPVLGLNPADGRAPLVFNWGVGSHFGWGVNGLNLMLTLADHPVFTPVAAQIHDPGEILLDPLREARLAPLLAQSREIWDVLARIDAEDLALEGPALIAITQDFTDPGRVAHGRRVWGQPHVGVAFLEHVGLSAEARGRARDFALIIAGCAWNERLLRAQGIHAVTTVTQGVDIALFHPAPKSGALGRDRFVVFSGGKLELRKGQDLVLAIFRAFHRRHPEALLMTAWFSPWSRLMENAVATRGIVSPRPTPDGHPDILAWAEDNAIPPEAVIAVGATPNIAMPHVIREADVALFPNRAEGGTNLVAMECLACGIPTILSANTGHLDLLRHPGVAIALTRQGAVNKPGVDTTEWGESDVEEGLEALETVWRDRQAARAMGERASRLMAGMDWRGQTALLLRAIEPLLA
jgi:glycosyltransferase involved in cell wall biosynthesis